MRGDRLSRLIGWFLGAGSEMYSTVAEKDCMNALKSYTRLDSWLERILNGASRI